MHQLGAKVNRSRLLEDKDDVRMGDLQSLQGHKSNAQVPHYSALEIGFRGRLTVCVTKIDPHVMFDVVS